MLSIVCRQMAADEQNKACYLNESRLELSNIVTRASARSWPFFEPLR